jgi:DNA-directed RNA polymerase subunit RPC12/RpoP
LICKNCGSSNVAPRGERLWCKDCGSRPMMKQTVTEHRQSNTAEVSADVPRIMTDRDLLKFLDVDMNEWEVTKVVYGKSEGYRKDRRVRWEVENGKVKYGIVDDNGELLIKPMFSVKVWLRKKAAEIAARNEVELIKKEAISYAPKYKAIRYPKQKDAYLYEIAMPDLQLGRLVMAEEAGQASNPDLYIRKAESAVNELLGVNYPIERILFPIGNDFFDSNTAAMTTAHGTPQSDDVRWQRTYKLAKKMMIGLIETMTQIAPVDVVTIKGNHDEERIFYFGDTLESWFHNNPNVTVDNEPKGRKYYPFGKVLLGLAHGYYEKPVKLDSLMAYEAPQLWAASQFREWHLGDKHHKSDMISKTEELENGVVVRILRSLAPPSVWEYDKGFVGSLKAAEGFLWHRERGLFAQFTALGDA